MKAVLIGLVFLLVQINQLSARVEKIIYRGWNDCYRISNKQCEVIVGASSGGRVLSFSLNGKNIIYENHTQNGKMLKDWDKERFDPDGGRFDFGPEKTTNSIHDQTWMGKWDVEIIDSLCIRMTMANDTLLGFKNTREFLLHSDSADLNISQIAVNITNKPLIRHFWGRTLVKPGGVLLMPIKPNSRFKHGWGRFLWDPDRIESPSEIDGIIALKPHVLSFNVTGKSLKGGTDATDGWMTYTLDSLVFSKRFEVSHDQNYSGSDHMTGIFYSNGKFCEMEPCSPTYSVASGDSIKFNERWVLSTSTPRDN